MKKSVIWLVLVLFAFTGFKWGGEEKKEESPRPQYNQTQKTPAAAARGGTAAGTNAGTTLRNAMGTDNPEDLKQRVESLARVSRALQAMNQAGAR